MFRKVIAMCLILFVLMAVCACNNDKTDPADTSASIEDITPPPSEPSDTTPPDADTSVTTPGNSGNETPTPTKVTYTVTVVDQANAPLAGATVQLCVGEICKLPVATDANGVATLELDEADYTVKVTLEGYTGEASYSFAEGATTITVQLTKVEAEVVAGTTAENPLEVTFDRRTMSATVTVPANSTYYFSAYSIAGMTLTANGTAVEVTSSMYPMMPSTFSITNSTADAVEYALLVTYPVGSMNNPAKLVMGNNAANIEANSQGYFYSFVAENAGSLTITMTGENWTYVINNMTSYAYGDTHFSDDDTVVTSETITVKKGDQIEIVIGTVDYTAANVSFTASFENAPGTTADNPFQVMFDRSTMSATVTVPANSTYYFCTYDNIAGMILAANDNAVEVTYGNMRMPSTFTITNGTDAEVTYTLVLSFPVGSMNNPASTDLDGWINVSLEEGDEDGYYYTYTAPADGTLTFNLGYIEGVIVDIVVQNTNTGAYRSLSADELNGLEVSEGDVLLIQVVVSPDMDNNWYIAAADFEWYGEFAYPEGSENNPIWFLPGNPVTVPANTTYYFSSYFFTPGCPFMVNGEEVEVTFDEWGIGTVCITNDTSENATYTTEVIYPEGSSENPAELVMGNNTASVPGEGTPYYYTFTAESAGNLTITMTGTNWSYTINNFGTGMYGDPITDVATQTINVDAGHGIQIIVYTADDSAADVTFTASFEEGEYVSTKGLSPEDPIYPMFDDNDCTYTVTIPAGTTYYFASYYISPEIPFTVNGDVYEVTYGEYGLSTFTITNEGAEDAIYTMKLNYPAGSSQNPESVELNGSNVVLSLAEGDSVGYYYTYTATGTGVVNFFISSITEGATANIYVCNTTAWSYNWLLDNGVDNGDGLELSVQVTEGDVLHIQVYVEPDMANDWYIAAADINWCGYFVAA